MWNISEKLLTKFRYSSSGWSVAFQREKTPSSYVVFYLIMLLVYLKVQCITLSAIRYSITQLWEKDLNIIKIKMILKVYNICGVSDISKNTVCLLILTYLEYGTQSSQLEVQQWHPYSVMYHGYRVCIFGFFFVHYILFSYYTYFNYSFLLSHNEVYKDHRDFHQGSYL